MKQACSKTLRAVLAAMLSAASVATISPAGPLDVLKSRPSGQQAIVARGGWVRIGLQRGARSTQVRVDGPVQVLAAGGKAVDAGQGGTFQVKGGGNSVTVSLNGKPIASGSSVVIAPGRGAAGEPGTFTISSGRYRGRLLLNGRGGGFDLVNQIMIDDWLKGVLPAEIGGEAPPEALKAQAVAARSEAVRKLIKPPHDNEGYDFCIGVHCQAYKGTKGETAASNAACDGTFGVVLTAAGEVLDGVYHNVCGGVTALPDDVWNSKPLPGFVAVYDAPGRPGTPDLSTDAAMARFLTSPPAGTFCDPAGKAGYPKYAQKYYRWQKSVTASRLQSAGGVGRVKDVRVVERRPSGRVRKLAIVGDRGTKIIEKELPIRNALDLWSGLFIVQTQKDSSGYVTSAVFTGAGNGHGVGLCQHGARVMASEGVSWDRILGHYYSGARLARIYRP